MFLRNGESSVPMHRPTPTSASKTHFNMSVSRLSAFRGRRVLLLQGPVGPFFARLAKDLRNAGAQVHKINFNGGDWFFYPKNAVNFRDTFHDWPSFLSRIIQAQGIDTLILFGDCRRYHRVALDIARDNGLQTWVFEEGYFRPNHVTLEREGVNGYSKLDIQGVIKQEPVQSIKDTPVGNSFWYMASWAMLYYFFAILCRPCFPKYNHHRPLATSECFYWLRSFWRKLRYRLSEKHLVPLLTGTLSKKFFLVPLQVHNDWQIQVHSSFATVEAFIEHAVCSFAQNAPRDTVLVIKHHPLDRGYSDYTQVLHQLETKLGLKGRLVYVHDLHLPSLLQHTRGVIVVNSTVGISALFHKAPVKTCGEAIYDIAGLTYQGSLDRFWADAERASVSPELFQQFRMHVLREAQINGNFYKRLPASTFHSGLLWEKDTRHVSADIRFTRPAKTGEIN